MRQTSFKLLKNNSCLLLSSTHSELQQFVQCSADTQYWIILTWQAQVPPDSQSQNTWNGGTLNNRLSAVLRTKQWQLIVTCA